MKKTICCLLIVAMVFSLCACGGGGTVDSGMADGAYTASAEGFGGPVVVTVTIADGAVSEVTVAGDDETATIGGAALDTLAEQIMAVGSAEIDGVAGATYTSTAAKDAAASCFAQANGEATPEPAEATVQMAPGTYTAEAYGFNAGWTDKVEVTVSETGITSIAFGESCGSSEPMISAAQTVLFPRIIENQSIAVDSVTGATATSSAVKTAVRDCLEQALAAGGSEESAINAFMNVPAKEGGSQEITTQVLVVGLGGSGTFAALSASENGAQVLAIEKQGRYGGNTTFTDEFMSINPERIKELYNNSEDFCDEDALYASWLEYVEGDAKIEMVDLFFAECGNALDWLAVDHGIQFDFAPKRGFTAADVYNVKFQWYPNEIGNNKGYIQANFDSLVATVVENGGSYMLDTEAYAYITDESGAVIGVKAYNKLTDTEYTIYADAVVEATGGFAGSPEMCQTYLSNEYYPLQGTWKVYGQMGNDGKMIQAAIDIGAATYNIGMPPEVHIAGSAEFIPLSYGFPLNEGMGFGFKSGTPSVWTVADLPMYMGIYNYSMAVDTNGERFTAEPGLAMLDPWIAGPNYYSVWSTTQINDLMENGFQYDLFSCASLFLSYMGFIPSNTPIPEAYDVLDAGMDVGFVYKADTIEELAEILGMDPATLTGTVETYNGYCAAGVDEDFGKPADFLVPIGEGPYYAIKMASYVYCTVGGLDVNESLQVLDTEGNIIPGLYAVGCDSAGVLFSEKKPYVTYGGANNGWGLVSGYLCGKSVAEYVSSLD